MLPVVKLSLLPLQDFRVIISLQTNLIKYIYLGISQIDSFSRNPQSYILTQLRLFVAS
jgi:hypothetical protein